LANCPHHCKQDLPKKVGVAGHALILRKNPYLSWIAVMDNKMRVKNNGGVFTLLTTLRSYPDNPDVVLSALKTLGNLVDLGKAKLSTSLIMSTA
jgi:hypothetical protein